jgi:hypothetical protein
MFPHYRYPKQFIYDLVRDALFQRPRRFSPDARACIGQLQPPLQTQGTEHVPLGGCFVVTPNHYFRHGFNSQWSALAISTAIPAEVHWIMTGELTFPGSWLAPIGRPVSRFILGRIARVYGFTTMPPMPPRQRDVAARASAVRSILRDVQRTEKPILGLAPEGGDQPGGKLSMPPPGVGRFCLLLAAAGLRFLPVGVYEQAGRLCLNFGAPYRVEIRETAAPHERDCLAAQLIMSRIAPLLPVELRGEFAV